MSGTSIIAQIFVPLSEIIANSRKGNSITKQVSNIKTQNMEATINNESTTIKWTAG